jgi:hypothetical protein
LHEVFLVFYLSEVTTLSGYGGSAIGRNYRKWLWWFHYRMELQEVVMVVQLSDVTAGSGYDG